MTVVRSVPLVGRAAEIATLEGALGERDTGAAPVVVVHGEAGIGKTALVARFAEQAADRGSTVLWGTCFEHSGPPYGPWVDAIDGFLSGQSREQAAELVGSDAGVLSALAAGITAVLGDVPEAPTLSPAEAQLRLFDAVARLFERLVEPVLVLDDMQWAEAGALDLLVHVARLVPRVLVVVIFRGGELDLVNPLAIRLARVCRVRSCTYLRLEGLSRHTAAELLEHAAGCKLEPELVEAICRETDGNPFFLCELGRHIERMGAWSVRHHAGWRLPETIRGAVGLRLAALSAGTREMLELATVFTGGFRFDELRSLTRMDEVELLDGVEEALRGELLRSVGGERYDFAHTLVRQALYDRLSPSHRARLHRRLATALEQLYEDPPGDVAGEIARQYRASATLVGAERGVGHALAAAQHARAVHAPWEAVELLQLALELVPGGDEALRTRVLGLLAVAEAHAAMPTRAVRTLEEAIGLIERGGAGGREIAELTCEVATAIWAVGAMPAGMAALIARALATLGEERSLLWARLKVLLCRLFEPIRLGPILMVPFVALDPEAVRIVREQGTEGDIATTIGPWEPFREEELEWAVAEIAHWRDPAARATALFWVVAHLTLLEPGSLNLAEALCNELETLADQTGALVHRAGVPVLRSALYAMRGSLDSAAEQIAEARRRFERLPETEQFLWFLACHALVAQHLDRAWRHVGEELWRVATLPGNPAIAPLCAALACYAFAQGETPGKARELLRDVLIPGLGAASRWDYTVAPAVAYAAAAVWELRDERLARELLPAAQAIIAAGTPDWYMSSNDLSVARLATVLGRYEDASAAYQRARSAVERHGQVPMRAIVDFDEALARSWRGTPGSAELLLAAEAQFEQLGMRAWSERVAALRRSFDGLPDHLTRREAEVLRLVASGLSNRQIAEQLMVSVHTVARHLQNTYCKIGAHNRADAAAYTLRHGL
jgi:DNA-binding CsgD family transcriptional regulator